MTVRCQILVLLFLVSSVVSGPTRGAAETPDGAQTTLMQVATPDGAQTTPMQVATPMTSLEPQAPAPLPEPPLLSTEATLAPQADAPTTETTTKSGPEAVAKISLTESTPNMTAVQSPPAPLHPADPAPSSTTNQMPVEDATTEQQDRCTEAVSGPGGIEGLPDTCTPSGGKPSDQSSVCIVDNVEYPNGARVPGTHDPCKPCFCHHQKVTCVELRCYRRRGCKPLFKAGVCCPTYDHCPPVTSNATEETERPGGNGEEGVFTGSFDVAAQSEVPVDPVTGTAAHLVDSSERQEEDSEEVRHDHDQDDDDDEDHDHSRHHYRKHHVLDSAATSSATTLHPGASFPFLVRGRVEVR